MRSLQRLLIGLLIGGVLLFALAYSGLLHPALYGMHASIEFVLGETPEAKAEAYLGAVRQGDRAAALACWPAIQRLGADYEDRRQRVTDQLVALGPALHHRVLDVEWWRTCCEPGRVSDPHTAGMARIHLRIMDDQGHSHLYTFDVGTTKQYWGEAGGDPVRRWVLWDVYPSEEHPLVFRWPLSEGDDAIVDEGGHPETTGMHQEGS